jgi:hypothetical protein
MQGKKILFLFLALLLPIGVFFFLKIFGKNEFAVKPLFQDELPEGFADCQAVHLPYKIDDPILRTILSKHDSLGIVYFKGENSKKESAGQLRRIQKEFKNDRIKLVVANHDSSLDQRCVFFLKKPYDLVLVDNKGIIRGQYASYDRDEMDRLITEVDIILKKY